MLRVQAKLRRLMLVGGITLVVGILAVFGAILYRIARTDANPAPPLAGPAVPGGAAAGGTVSLAGLGLPADAHLVSAGEAGGRIVLTYAAGADTVLVLVDPATAAIAGTLRLTP